MNILRYLIIYSVRILFDLYILALILRILFLCVKTNPIAPFRDFIFDLTDRPMNFLNRFIPKIGPIELSTLFSIGVLKLIELSLLDLLILEIPHFKLISLWTLRSLLIQVLNLYFYLILFRVFIHWTMPQQKTRTMETIDQLTHPIISPIARFIPPIAGFDLSPFIALILLQLGLIITTGPLTQIGMKLILNV